MPLRQGKVAAANIDAYLGFEHKIKTDVVVPPAHLTNAPPCGRVNLKSHCTPDCKGNFDLVVEGMSRKEADQESERCRVVITSALAASEEGGQENGKNND